MHRKSAKERDHLSLACGVLELSHRYLLIVHDGDPQRSSTSIVPVHVHAFAARFTVSGEHDARATARRNTHRNSTLESIQRNSNCVCVDSFPVSVIFLSTISAVREK
jgi:hypothetical protein